MQELKERSRTPIELVIDMLCNSTKRLNKKSLLKFLIESSIKDEKQFAFYYFKQGVINPVFFNEWETEDDFKKVWNKNEYLK